MLELGQEVAADRRHPRDHQRAGRADQHPGHQRHHRGGGRGRSRASASPWSPTRSASSPIAWAARPRRSAALIDDVRSAVNTTVMATEGGSKAVDAGARQFAEVASVVQADHRPGRDHDRGGAGDRAVHQAADDRGRAGQHGHRQRRPGHARDRGQLEPDAADVVAAHRAVARSLAPGSAADLTDGRRSLPVLPHRGARAARRTVGGRAGAREGRRRKGHRGSSVALRPHAQGRGAGGEAAGHRRCRARHRRAAGAAARRQRRRQAGDRSAACSCATRSASRSRRSTASSRPKSRARRRRWKRCASSWASWTRSSEGSPRPACSSRR